LIACTRIEEQAMTPRSFAIAGMVSLVLAACATSPTGRRQLLMMSDTQMDEMGALAFERMKASDKLSRDSRRIAYVNCVVAALTRELPAPWSQRRWEAQVFAVDSPNAFALPGGKVGVNTGLFDVARTQDQLAAVIGHEIGHVIARHSNERVSQSQLAQVGATALGAYAGRNASPEQVKQYVALLGAGTQVGVLLPYARDQEREADLIGQDVMASAGFDPAQAADLWRNMIAATQDTGRPPRLLSTHPDPGARAGELERRAPALVPRFDSARAAGKRPQCG
jgi:predicted Zn-dependent protease